jgi:hypothetical protein
MGMSSPPNGNYNEVTDRISQMDETDNVIPLIFKVPQDEMNELMEMTSPSEQYRLALESIFRWTLRRDELNDSQIVLAIKRVAKYALEDV